MRVIAPITDTAIRNAKPGDKPRRIFDGKVSGLHLLIQPAGSKLWRLKYQNNGTEKRVSLGKYPEVSLIEAREAAERLKKGVRQAKAEAASASSIVTFAEVAEQFVRWKIESFARSDMTVKRYHEILRTDILPAFGSRDIESIGVRESVLLLESIDARSNAVANKAKELISMIMRYAIQRGLRESGALDLRGVVVRKKARVKAMPTDLTVTYQKKIGRYPEVVMRAAMRIQFLCFLRGAETMGARWSEIDFEKRLWTVPDERMKMRRAHIVPLSDQAIAVLEDLRLITGSSEYVFASLRGEHLVRDALSKAFRTAGLGLVPHACRAAFSTHMKNAGFAHHLVEIQLSHIEKNQVVAAYLHKPHEMYLPERAQMMQAWGDFVTVTKCLS